MLTPQERELIVQRAVHDAAVEVSRRIVQETPIHHGGIGRYRGRMA